MRVIAVLLLLLTAFMNLFAGLGYVAGGALMGSVLSMVTDTVGSVGQDLAAQSGLEITPGMADGLSQARDEGMLAGWMLLGYGAFLLVSVIVLLAGAMCLLRRTREKVIYTAGGVAILGEVGSLYLASFAIGIGNVIGLLAGLLALLAARGLTGAPVKVKGQAKKSKSKESAPAVRIEGDRPPFGLVDALLAGIVGVGVLLIAGSGYLYYEREFAGSVPMSSAVAATRDSLPGETKQRKKKRKKTAQQKQSDPQPQRKASRDAAPGEPAHGSIRGKAFTVDRAEYQNGVLTLRQGEEFFADASFAIFLFDQGDGLPEESHYKVDGDITGQTPHVHVSLKGDGKDAPETEIYTSGYTMELAFAERDGVTIPGRILLEVDENGTTSRVEGDFTAIINGWVEVLAPDEYVPDPTTDDFDTLKYLARARLLEMHDGMNVEVLDFTEASFGTYGANSGSGKVTVDFSVDGGDKKTLEFTLERDSGGWQVTEASEKSQTT